MKRACRSEAESFRRSAGAFVHILTGAVLAVGTITNSLGEGADSAAPVSPVSRVQQDYPVSGTRPVDGWLARKPYRPFLDAGGSCKIEDYGPTWKKEGQAIPGIEEDLISMLGDRSDSNRTEDAIIGLGMVGGTNAVSALVEILARPDEPPQMCFLAGWALDQIRIRPSAAALRRAVEHGSEQARLEVCSLLVTITEESRGDGTARRMLYAMMNNDASERVKAWARQCWQATESYRVIGEVRVIGGSTSSAENFTKSTDREGADGGQ